MFSVELGARLLIYYIVVPTIPLVSSRPGPFRARSYSQSQAGAVVAYRLPYNRIALRTFNKSSRVASPLGRYVVLLKGPY